jgi:uncharacterized protein YecE (DUF72 family)
MSEIMKEFYVGTSGWAYKTWQPDFFPPKLPQKQFLRYYATKLNTVEVNYTFRHLLSEQTITNWLVETPENFRFVVKAHQAITHFHRLRNVDEPLLRFLSSIQPLAAAHRLGPVLFQFPGLFKADPEALDSFLAMLPRSLKVAFEFRDKSWFQQSTYEILRRHRAALCIAESEDFATPEIITADFIYFRYRKPDYKASERSSIVTNLAKVSGQTEEIYAFFKHLESPESPLHALDVLRKLSVAAQKVS